MPTLRLLVQTADREEYGQDLRSNAVIALNPVSGGVAGQDVVMESGMCTPFPGESQRDCRIGDARMGNDSGFVSDTIPSPPSAPTQALPPVLTSGGRGDSGGVPSVFSPEELAIWSKVMSDDAPALQRSAAVNHLGTNVSQASNIQLACQAEGLGVRPVSGRNAPGISTSAYALETGISAIPVWMFVRAVM